MLKLIINLHPIIKGALILFIGKLLYGFILGPLTFRFFTGFNNIYFQLYGLNATLKLIELAVYIIAGFVIGKDSRSKLSYGLIASLLYILFIRLFYIGETLLFFPTDQKAKYIDAIFKSTFTLYILLELLPIVTFVLLGFWISRKFKTKNGS